MKNKICRSCNSVNGERATYCRKCGASLDDALIKEVVPKDEPKTAFRAAPRSAEQVAKERERANDPGRTSRGTVRGVAKPKNVLAVTPKCPVKPKVLYWPFIVSMVSALAMFTLIIVFAVDYQNSNNDPASPQSAGSAAQTSAQTESVPADLSEASFDAVEDQIYTGEPLTPQLSLVLNGEDLTEGEDYTVTYEDNVSLGTAAVYIDGIDGYTGTLTASFNIVSGDAVCDDPANRGIVDLVMRLSSSMLGRNPTSDELTDQVNRLKNEEITGSDLVNEIIFGDECEARGLSDNDFVSAFYYGVLARQADEQGLAYNVALLEDGMSRSDLVNSIISDPDGEFAIICNTIGIETL